MTRNFGWTFGRTPQGRDEEYADLIKRLEAPTSVNPGSNPSTPASANPAQMSPVTAQTKAGFIYVPSVNLYFAKERSALGKNWYDSHKELIAQRLRMPTIPEFVELLKYLRDNPSNENTKIYNDIIEVRSPWRAEWLDADYKVKSDGLYVNFRHELKSGVLVPKYSEKLDPCLMKDKTPGISLDDWLNNPTRHGLPKTAVKKGSLYYYFPRDDNNSVARFDASTDRALLSCYWSPYVTGASLGVRACAEGAGAPKN
jgi:hypothetical protein